MEEALACAEAGITVEVVPGVSSATGVPALAGVPLTHRGLAQEFAVVAGHVPPDDPASRVDWAALGRLRGTLVLLMAVDNAAAIARELIRHGRRADTPTAVIQEGALPTQRTVTARLDELAAEIARHSIRPPAVIVIGDVVALRDVNLTHAEAGRIERPAPTTNPSGADCPSRAAEHQSEGDHPDPE
jgi:uroporphyrin-III C-methyltransferase/precorrin-2 dehydrogenase/sirohydrochlorin ferrochelatase